MKIGDVCVFVHVCGGEQVKAAKTPFNDNGMFQKQGLKLIKQQQQQQRQNNNHNSNNKAEIQ